MSPVIAQVSTPSSVIQAQQNPRDLAAEAKKLYNSDDFQNASQLWEQTANAFAKSGEGLNQAMALSNLSLTYQQLGKWKEAEEEIQESIDLLNTAPANSLVLAQTLDIQGNLQRETGKPVEALNSWKKAENIYEELGKSIALEQNKLNQVQVMQDLGLYPRACKTLLGLLGTPFEDLTCPPLEQQIPGQKTSELLTATQLKDKVQEIQNNSLSLLKVSELRNLGDVLRVLGQQEQSQAILINSLGLAGQLDSSQNIDKISSEISAIYLSLGNTVRGIKDKAVCNLNKNNYISQFLHKEKLGLPNNPQIPCNKIALAYYKEAENKSSTKVNKVQSQLNQLSLLVGESELKVPDISSLLEKLDDSNSKKGFKNENLASNREEVYAQVNLAQSLICLNTRINKSQLDLVSPIVQQCTFTNEENKTDENKLSEVKQKYSWENIKGILTSALAKAQNLDNKRLEAYALGYLGGIAQQQQDYISAKESTQQALNLIPRNKWNNISYLWYWQLGRLNQLQNQRQNAIESYISAFEDLKSLRGDIVAINPDLQFNFRDSVEPVYRELVDLLLQEENPSQDTLKQAREAIEALKIAELDNFFRDVCAEIEEVNVKEIDPNAGFVYSIVLPDRLEVILELPDKPLRHYSTVNFGYDNKTFESEIGSQINVIRNLIENKRRKPLREEYETEAILGLSQQIYSWLFDSDATTELKNSFVETLVFLMDDVLQNIPISILHDGEQYLIQEGYRLAISPGLQLLPPKRLEKEKIKVLAAGRSKFKELNPKPELEDLENVENELKIISEEFPGKVLLNQDFISDNIDLGINSLVTPIVHIATHSQFSSKLEDTYIIEWNGFIYPQDLADLMQVRDSTKQSDIELLVLSACQTAAGDNRAALGMAGIAVRSGARSTLATLWNIADDSTAKLMVKFYEELNNSSGNQVEKAEALRLAQKWLLDGEEGEKYQDPFYWAPFVLVGNWL